MRAIIIAVAVSATAASAEPPGLTPVTQPAPRPATESYGLQTAAADAIAVGLAALAVADKSPHTGELALGVYLLGAPFVHLAHGNPRRAETSVGMRAALPLTGMLVGLMVYGATCRPCSVEDDGWGIGVEAGFAAGIVTATIIDAVYLAKGDDHQWWATLAPQRGGVSLGLAGLF